MTTERIGKGIPRVIEVLVAALALLVAAPVIVVAMIGVALSSGWPTIFRQSRVGRNGINFTLYKLRTMRTSNSGPQVTSGDDARVTTVGKVLRKTKLDELPTLWNVITGDMSLVGPRPEVPRYVDLTNPSWTKVLAVRPGLTDPITLQLRNEEELLERVAGDRESFYLQKLQPLKLNGYLEYLRTRTLLSDIRVLWSSAVAVVLPGQAPPPAVENVLAERLHNY